MVNVDLHSILDSVTTTNFDGTTLSVLPSSRLLESSDATTGGQCELVERFFMLTSLYIACKNKESGKDYFRIPLPTLTILTDSSSTTELKIKCSFLTTPLVLSHVDSNGMRTSASPMILTI